MQMAAAAHSSIMQQAQLRGRRPGHGVPLKDQLGLGHVELSEKYDRHYTRTCGGRVVTVGDLQRHAVGGVQLVLGRGDPTSPHPVLPFTAVASRRYTELLLRHLHVTLVSFDTDSLHTCQILLLADGRTLANPILRSTG